MNGALAPNRTTIARLRLRPGATDPMLARLRAGTLLSSVALEPPGLPPAAMLVVRRLRDPMPGRLGLRTPGVRPPAEWTHAVRSRMAAFARRAARPAREAAAEGAEAVLFADEAEVLACLARDWLRGELQRWWWQAIFPGHDTAGAVLRAWLERAASVPAAVAQLAATAEERELVSRLGREGVARLLESVLAVYALPELRSALAPVLRPHRTSPRDANERVTAVDLGNDGGGVSSATAPWREVLGQAGRFSEPVAEAFVGACLSLHHAPHVVRSREFTEAVRRWAASQHLAEPPPLSRGGAMQEIVPAERVPGGQALAVVPEVAPRSVKGTPVESAQVTRSVAPAGATETKAAPRALETTAVPSLGVPAQEAKRQDPPSRVRLLAPTREEWRIATQFGGVFFLVNVALALGLYGDFAHPRRRSLDLSLWDFLAAAGEKLAGPELRDDPVWVLLAQLANRDEAEEPGASLPPRRRLALRRWLARLLPRLRTRLCHALGLVPAADGVSVLLALPAQVWITATRLDVSFALAELPVAVRLSGLDRDPGWVPAAGRSVVFHFD